MSLAKTTFIILSIRALFSISAPLDYELQPMAVEEMENILSNPQEGLRVDESPSDLVCHPSK